MLTAPNDELSGSPESTPASAEPARTVAEATETVLAFFSVVRRLAHVDARQPGHPKAWPILGRLAKAGSMRVADLADFAGLDASTMSRHVRTLEDDGLVARDTDPEDRRAASVRITDQGRAFMHEAIDVRGRFLAEATGDWTATEREQFATLMRRLAKTLETEIPKHRTETESST